MLSLRKLELDYEYFYINKNSTMSRKVFYKLWYDIYYKEMKRKLEYIDHFNQTLIDDLEPYSYLIFSKNNKEIVGTFRINLPEDSNLGYYQEFYQLNNFTVSEVAIGTRFMVSPTHRGNYISHKLISTAINLLREMGKKILIIDCNTSVYKLFIKLGFTDYLGIKISKEFGNVNIMKYEIK